MPAQQGLSVTPLCSGSGTTPSPPTAGLTRWQWPLWSSAFPSGQSRQGPGLLSFRAALGVDYGAGPHAMFE